MEKIYKKKTIFMPLILPTIAALTPDHYDVFACDENVEKIDFDSDCDIIAISCWSVHSERAFAVAKEFRRKGKLVVMGGPHPTVCPNECLKHSDVVFIGESELTWPKFIEDYEHSEYQSIYKSAERTDMSKAPIPRFDVLKLSEYYIHCMQTTRGCPFTCEFCDIPVVYGHKPRTKMPEQVIEELKILQKNGARHIFMCNDNFVGNKTHAKEVCKAIIEYQKMTKSKITFSTEMTIDVARDDELLELLHDANFVSVFIGIESPRVSSLKETHKFQNTKRPLLDDIRKIQGYSIAIVAGMIVGFDHDDLEIFQDHFNFTMEANITSITPSILQALTGTALEARMKKENRLIEKDHNPIQLNYHQPKSNVCNIIPKQLTVEQLTIGHQWLWRKVYQSETYSKRVIENTHWFGKIKAKEKLSFRENVETIIFALYTLKEFVWTTDKKRRKFFIHLTRNILKQKFNFVRLRTVLMAAWYHRFIRDVIIKAYKFGDPELVSDKPFIEKMNNAEQRVRKELSEAM